MSSGYYYKGIDLSNIYVNDGTIIDSNGFNIPVAKGKYFNYSGMRPNSFGYTVSGVDLCNTATANYALYTDSTTTNVDIPSGVKSCRVISVGGAGGGGGAGGKATSKAYFNSNSKSSFGGDGGVGGYGGYNYSKLNLDSVSKIQVVVGSAGKGGTSGDNNSTHMNIASTDTSNNTKGGDGNSGNAGNSSYIYFDNNTTSHYAVANGGNGGGGGNGAFAKAEFSTSSSNSGKSGSTGNSTESQAKDTNYPQLISYTIPAYTYTDPITGVTTKITDSRSYYAGVPSNGADASNSEDTGYTGTNGAVQIIWLYD